MVSGTSDSVQGSSWQGEMVSGTSDSVQGSSWQGEMVSGTSDSVQREQLARGDGDNVYINHDMHVERIGTGRGY